MKLGSCDCADITLEFFILWLFIALGFGGMFVFYNCGFDYKMGDVLVGE